MSVCQGWATLTERLRVHQIVVDPVDGLEYQVLRIDDAFWPGGPRMLSMTRGDGSVTFVSEARFVSLEAFEPPPPPMPWERDDGGREAAGYRGVTGDCAVRAAAIATDLPYQAVYDRVNQLAKRERPRKGQRRRSMARDGVHRSTFRRLIAELPGWTWHPKMQIGSGCTVHLRPDELPTEGRYVLSLSGHYAALVDGVVRDTHCDDRHGTRCVYGWWTGPRLEAVPEGWVGVTPLTGGPRGSTPSPNP